MKPNPAVTDTPWSCCDSRWGALPAEPRAGRAVRNGHSRRGVGSSWRRQLGMLRPGSAQAQAHRER